MTPETVLEFWFGQPAGTQDEVLSKIRLWFGGGEVMDREVRERFGEAVERAVGGELTEWEGDARSRLALVLLLDQFTRNVFRDDPRTYAGDHRAQELARDAFDRGMDHELSYIEAMFLSMPLLHSEDLALHERLGPIIAALSERAPPEYAQLAGMNREQVVKYRDIVGRFARFPHRNALLGRASTPEEEAFLVDWHKKGPPAGAPVRRG